MPLRGGKGHEREMWSLAITVAVAAAVRAPASLHPLPTRSAMLGARSCATGPRARIRACDPPAENETAAVDFSFESFMGEARRRGLDNFDRMRSRGPHAEIAPRTVVEFVLHSLREGDLKSAFSFTALPPEIAGKGMANAPLDRRMDWSTARVINGNPTGGVLDLAQFEAMVHDRFSFLLHGKAADGFAFAGDAPKWGKPNVPVHADQEYFVEVGNALVRIELTYCWLLVCHVVTSMRVLRAPVDGYAGLPDGMRLPEDM